LLLLQTQYLIQYMYTILLLKCYLFPI